MGELLTVAEAAERLKVTEQTVRELCRRGEISARRFGGRWRIDPEGLRVPPARRREPVVTYGWYGPHQGAARD